MAREQTTESESQEQSEIMPGEGVDIHLARLESGEWAGRIGRPDDEDAISFTSAFPWEVLRGLAKQVKQADGQLVAFRIAGEQEMALCPHAAGDGTVCVMLGCPIEDVEGRVAELRAVSAHLGDGFAAALGGEIVRLHGTLKEPNLKGKGEDEDVLTATFEIAGEDLTPEYRYLKPSAKKQVVAIVYHAYAAPAKPKVDPDQRAMEFPDGGEDAPVVETCGDLVRFVPQDRVDEISDAIVSDEELDAGKVQSLPQIGNDRFLVTQATQESGEWPIFEAWRAVPMSEYEGGEYRSVFVRDENTDPDKLRVTLGEDGAAFVLVGPPVQILVQPEEGEAESEGGDEPIEGDAD